MNNLTVKEQRIKLAVNSRSVTAGIIPDVSSDTDRPDSSPTFSCLNGSPAVAALTDNFLSPTAAANSKCTKRRSDCVCCGSAQRNRERDVMMKAEVCPSHRVGMESAGRHETGGSPR